LAREGMNEASSLASQAPLCGRPVLIQRGDKHEIRNTGKAQLKTLNF
jgi:hypothetical protein